MPGHRGSRSSRRPVRAFARIRDDQGRLSPQADRTHLRVEVAEVLGAQRSRTLCRAARHVDQGTSLSKSDVSKSDARGEAREIARRCQDPEPQVAEQSALWLRTCRNAKRAKVWSVEAAIPKGVARGLHATPLRFIQSAKFLLRSNSYFPFRSKSPIPPEVLVYESSAYRVRIQADDQARESADP